MSAALEPSSEREKRGLFVSRKTTDLVASLAGAARVQIRELCDEPYREVLV